MYQLFFTIISSKYKKIYNLLDHEFYHEYNLLLHAHTHNIMLLIARNKYSLLTYIKTDTSRVVEFDPSTFEHLCARINSCGVSCIALVIYRPGSEHVTQQFFREFSKLLTYLGNLVVANHHHRRHQSASIARMTQ